MTDLVDEDLHEVFRILYADEDDWDMSEEEEHPPLDSLVPGIELDLSDPSLAVAVAEDTYLTTTYTRKRFRSEIDHLVFPNTKKRRIFTHSSHSNPRYIPSTSALPTLPSTSSFEPFSPLALLGRLRTFHPSTYSPSYPSSISATKLAMGGWVNVGVDALGCGVCGAKWGVGGLGDIGDSRVREEVGRRLAGTMSGRHKPGCGWRVAVCPDNLMDLLRNTLHPPLASDIALLALRYTSLPSLTQTALDSLNLVSPLGPKHISRLITALTRSILDDDNPQPQITANAAQLAIFGWAPHELAPEVLSCRTCQRRLGLWSFTSGRQLDLVGEHLGWCPIGAGEWWESAPLVNGGKASVKDLPVSSGVHRPKWLQPRSSAVKSTS